MCSGGAAVGASSKQPGIGCAAAAQHPGELPSQRYCVSLTGKATVPECCNVVMNVVSYDACDGSVKGLVVYLLKIVRNKAS